MSANSFGDRLVVTTFGESHGPAMGAIVDGCPAGLDFDLELLQENLDRRRPGRKDLKVSGLGSSTRQELDRVEVLSGIFENKTLGTPICMIVRNVDQRSADYEALKNQLRPGHADAVWRNKFGHVDHRGGGRSSGRETVSRVMAGSVAQMICRALFPKTEILAFTKSIGSISMTTPQVLDVCSANFSILKERVLASPGRCPQADHHDEITRLLEDLQQSGNSVGGTSMVCVKNLPAGMGQPVFHKLKSDFAQAFLSIGATESLRIGNSSREEQDSGHVFHSQNSRAVYGGIQGGISTGEPVYIEIGFKPTASILDVAKKGRHDPFIVPRALPVLESMAWFVLANHMLWMKTDRID